MFSRRRLCVIAALAAIGVVATPATIDGGPEGADAAVAHPPTFPPSATVTAAAAATTTPPVMTPPVDLDRLGDDAPAVWGLAVATATGDADDRTTARGTAPSGPGAPLGLAIEEAGGSIIVGGAFDRLTDGRRSHHQPYLAALALDGATRRAEFRPAVDGPVHALEAADDGGLFVGGAFANLAGRTIGPLVKLDPVTGEPWPEWATTLAGGEAVVHDLVVGPDGWLYVAGAFAAVADDDGKHPADGVIRLDPATGVVDLSWRPNTDGRGAWAISPSHVDPVVYVAGGGAGQGRSLLGRSAVHPGVVLWEGPAIDERLACCRRQLDVLATPFGTVFVADDGETVQVYDEHDERSLAAEHRLVDRSDVDAGRLRRGGDVWNLELVGDRVVASCACWGVNATVFDPTGAGRDPSGGHRATGPSHGVIAYDAATGTLDPALQPHLTGGAGGRAALAASDGCLWLTGDFDAIGRGLDVVTAVRHLVRLCPGEGAIDAAPHVAPIETCSASRRGGSIVVTWSGAEEAPRRSIERRLGAGAWTWRAVATGSMVADTAPPPGGEAVAYRVTALDDAGRGGRPATCAPTPPSGELATLAGPSGGSDVPRPPTSCRVEVVDGVATLTWTPVAGAEDYVVRRAVGDGRWYRLGRVDHAPDASPSFTATMAPDERHAVAARTADRIESDPTVCTASGGRSSPPALTVPVRACHVTATDDGRLLVWWASSAVAADASGSMTHLIHRRVGDGPRLWRAEVALDTTAVFDDRPATDNVTYTVVRRLGAATSAPTTCINEGTEAP
ncbi:MAG: hypothetical protein AAGD35_03395 [Actinomycetota bacterium]